MRRDKFLRLVEEIKEGKIKNKKDRENFLEIVNEYIFKEDKERFLFLDKKGAKILNETLFNEFVDFYLSSFPKKTFSKKEAIKLNKNSKRGSIFTNEKIIVYRKREKRAEIFYKEFPLTSKKIVVVENLESLLEIDFNLFDEEDFIYLGGFSSSFVREFLKNKEVLFFVDFDFFGIEIYNSIDCKRKEFFIPSNLEELMQKYGSTELYKKQCFKKESLKVDKNTKKIFNLINKYSKCLEQEILNEN